MTPLTANVAAVAVQAAVLAVVGAPLPRLLGITSPRARLAYWRLLLLACLLLPAAQPWLPLPAAAEPPPSSLTDVAQAGPAGLVAAVDAGTAPDSWLRRVEPVGLLAAGVAVRAAWFAFGLFTLGRLRRRTAALEPRPGSVVDAIGLAAADAEFRITASPTRPVTFGLLRPVVVVPSDFPAFTEDEQKAIACHELVHVRRRDWVRNLGDELVRVIAWFHPAAWWLTRQVRLAREQVVDQEVVGRLGARKPYLDALLRLASPDRGSALVPAPLFLGRSHLADRVALILKEVRMSRPRLALSFVAVAAILFLAGRAVTAAFPLYAGSVAPQAAGAAKPKVGASRPGEMTAPRQAPKAKAAAKLHDVRPAFPAGSPSTPVIVSAQVDESGAVAGASLVSGPADLGDIALGAVRQWTFSPRRPATIVVGFNPASASSDPANQPPVLVGESVRAPKRVVDRKPVYPADARAAHVQGIVVLETRVAPDGSVADARVLHSVPMLDTAAIEAVLGWKFTPAGFPLQMTVTVNFVLDDRPKQGIGSGEGVGVGVAGGVPGGVRGGVGAGVAGGVDGGVPAGDKDLSPWVELSGGGRALSVRGDVKAPRKVVDVKAVYPKDARDAGIQGVVILEIVIGPDGRVKDAKVLQSVPTLDEAALEAVRQWEFEPVHLNGAPVTVVMKVTVNFTLQ